MSKVEIDGKLNISVLAEGLGVNIEKWIKRYKNADYILQKTENKEPGIIKVDGDYYVETNYIIAFNMDHNKAFRKHVIRTYLENKNEKR